jgi:hypothetical protein
MLFSLAIPLYCIPTGFIALFRRSPYSPWPLLLMVPIWAVQWPLAFVVLLLLPNSGSIGGDSHDTLPGDAAFLLALLVYNAGPMYWVYRHRARFVYEE